GGERPETYRHVDEFSAWLTQRGYPAVVTVRQRVTARGEEVATLEDECLRCERLPGIAYGFGSCSEKWKQRPFRAWLKAREWEKVTVCFGFDADEAHAQNAATSTKAGMR